MTQAGLGYKFRFACWRTVCGSSSEHRSISKLEHSVATRRKWVLMSFPAFIFCTVRHPYGSTKMSATPAGANILQPPWWHCRQSFTCSQVIACSRHTVYLWIKCVRVCVWKEGLLCLQGECNRRTAWFSLRAVAGTWIIPQHCAFMMVHVILIVFHVRHTSSHLHLAARTSKFWRPLQKLASPRLP